VLGTLKEKTKKPRVRKNCPHCNIVHNIHNDSDYGCHNAKKLTGQNLGPKISAAKTQKKRKAVNLPSSDSSQSEQGEIFMPDASDSGGNESDVYDPKSDQDDEESSDEEKTNKANVIANFIDEEYQKGGTSSDSFSDASSYESSVEDELRDMFDEESDQDVEESSEDPNSDEEEETTWTLEVLETIATGDFTSERTAFPRYKNPFASGPMNNPPATSFPVDYFQLYFDIELLEMFVKATNEVGSKIFAKRRTIVNGSHLGRWKPSTLGELYRLFGVFLHMGIKRQPTMRSYWSQDPRYSDAFVKKCFTRDRFEMLKSALHITNSYAMSVEEQKIAQKADVFWRVTPFLDHICLRFMRFFVCHQNIDIDEMCIGFKGRHVARCYNPKKPEKWHFKAFCLNDSSTGYLQRFYMYQGVTIYLILTSHI
jgi:hypothetical protein